MSSIDAGVRELFASQFNCSSDAITASTTPADLGGDSLDLAEIAIKVEDHFGVVLNVQDLQAQTVQEITEHVERVVGTRR